MMMRLLAIYSFSPGNSTLCRWEIRMSKVKEEFVEHCCSKQIRCSTAGYGPVIMECSNKDTKCMDGEVKKNQLDAWKVPRSLGVNCETWAKY